VRVFVSTIWEHKWLTIRAVATGWVFSMIVIRTGMREIVHRGGTA
jgi:hypothetical protein